MGEMHELVAAGNLAGMEHAILRAPQLVNERNESGLSPLYTAALHRHQSAIDFLLDHGADVDIFACAYLNRAADAQSLLEQNAELAGSSTPDGMTPLHYAARAGHCDVAAILLKYDADVNVRDKKGTTPLDEACHAGPWKQEPAEAIIDLLLDHDAQIDLFTAAAIGRKNLLLESLDWEDTDINALNAKGESALFVAARNNRLEAVKLLVDRGADVNQCDAVGTAALHRTSQQCSDELIQYLIDHGANAHLCCYVACGDEDGTRRALADNPAEAGETLYEFNAVGYAIHSWQLGTLRILLQHGSTLTGEDQQHILRISNHDRQLLDQLLSIVADNQA